MARNDLPRMIRDVRNVSAQAAYNGPVRVAENVVRELQIKGPGWTGKFSNSWNIKTPITTVSGSESAGEARRITVPRLSGERTKILYKRNTAVFNIYNTASYAGIAVDKEQGLFVRVGEPIKPVEKTGVRADGIRGKLQGTGGNSRTAPYNWYSIYVLGGAMNKTISTTLSRVLQ